jgi:hypothetical protein
MEFDDINLEKLCDEKTFEICAIKITINAIKLILFCIYRAPSGKVNQFFRLLEKTMNSLYQATVTFVVRGDLNINLLNDNMNKQKLVSIMETFNLTQVVNFPTRICNNKETIIDSLFIDRMKFKNILVFPFVNGLSDHDAQIVSLDNIKTLALHSVSKKKFRIINDFTLMNFLSSLKKESWLTVYEAKNVNGMFNNFHFTFQRIFESSFPIVYKGYKSHDNGWITTGIRISCKRKQSLYIICRTSGNRLAQEYYKKYCKVLKKVIVKAKKNYYNRQIESSSNKLKTIWKIIKESTRNVQPINAIREIHTGCRQITDKQEIANHFNKIFVNVASYAHNHIDMCKVCQLLKAKDTNKSIDMKVIPVTEAEVINVIGSIQCKSSTGFDEISSKILQ